MPDPIAALASQPWAILHSALEGYAARLPELAGDPFADADPAAVAAVQAARGAGARTGTVAVVPILGPITKRDNLFSMFFGGTSVNSTIATLRSLAADESVATILLNVDSPGGTTSGLPELAAEIRRVRETKRVVGIANDVAASAAYWVLSQADEVVATPESITGSIGAYVMHIDASRALDQEGITVTWIKAGERKVDGNPSEPLSDRARDEIQTIVDNAYGLFVADVATGRNVPPATVRSEEWGEGAVLTAKAAKKAGLVDRIESYTETIARLAGAKRPSGVRADISGELRARRWQLHR